jgi:hypothetical protein
MKTVPYRLPAGLHPALDPVEVSRKPGKPNPKAPNEPVKDIVEYKYNEVPIRKAESEDEFRGLVATDDPSKHVLSLLNQQRALLAQRVVRERAESKEVAAMFDGTDPATANLDAAARLVYVLQDLANTEAAWLYNSKPPATGGVVAEAKRALEVAKAAEEAASKDKVLAKLKAQYEAKLMELGITV